MIPIKISSTNSASGGQQLPRCSLCERIGRIYNEVIKRLVEFLDKHKWYITRMVLGTLLSEPWQAIKAGFLRLANLKRHFNYYQMNPKTLTQEQARKTPILLIHGNYHDQSAWLSLAKVLQKSELGPVYTVNLPNGLITKKDREILDQKINDIQAQYQKLGIENVAIDLVGHSRGAFLAGDLSAIEYRQGSDGKERAYWFFSKSFRKIIRIGSVFSKEEQKEMSNLPERYAVEVKKYRERLYEICGECDILATNPSSCDENHQALIPATGHLGLLSSQKTHELVVQWLIN